MRETASFLTATTTRRKQATCAFSPESLLTSLSRILIRNPASSCEVELEVDLALRGGIMDKKIIKTERKATTDENVDRWYLTICKRKRMILNTVQAPFMRLPGSCIHYNSLPGSATPSLLRHSKKNDASHFIPGVSQREAQLLPVNWRKKFAFLSPHVRRPGKAFQDHTGV